MTDVSAMGPKWITYRKAILDYRQRKLIKEKSDNLSRTGQVNFRKQLES